MESETLTVSSSDESSRFASALSVEPDVGKAVAEVCDRTTDTIGGPPDLAVMFVSADRADICDQIAADVCNRLGSDRLVGCTGESIVGVGREVESGSAMSLWLARLPGAHVQPMHLTFERTSEGGSVLGWPDQLVHGWPADCSLLVLGEPFTFPAELLLEQMNDQHPGVAVIGGMASGGAAPGENRLLLGRQSLGDGAVAVLFSGSVRVHPLVSQGCRPVGKHFVVTKAERNVIYELGGKPALVQLQAVFSELPTRDQELVNQGLHVGRVVSEYQDRFEQGDFLVRNVIGADPESGAVAIGDYVRVGQTVQYHVRDWQTADADLRQLLAESGKRSVSSSDGALLFTCNGRGTRLFPEPHHDALAIKNALGDIPLAGFFAQGELGPVGGKNFMHGFTASMALFEQP
jgi:small ligand-binding sensory domain FIST